MIPDMLECFENLLHELGKKDWNQRFDVLPEKEKEKLKIQRVQECRSVWNACIGLL